MDLISIVILLAVAVGLVLYSVLPKSKDSRDAMKRRLEGRTGVDEKAEIREKAKVNASAALVKKATPVLSKIIMPISSAEQTQLRAKLIAAGYRQPQAQTVLLASKTALMVVCAILGGVVGPSLGYGLNVTVACVVGGAGLGFIAPGFWLGSAISARQEKIRRGLPDILDLLVVSIESGLALDAGIKRVGEEMAYVHPDLSEEFRIATRESQMGIPRSEALENMAVRVGLDELRSLVSVVMQAERFGTSVGKALRTQGEALRTKRRQKAEEKAQKTAVKLMIPLVMFIFPAMGVVLAGPAALRLMEAFSK